MANMIQLEINGKKVEVPQGTSLLNAARAASISIPNLCYHPDLKPGAACGLCICRQLVPDRRDPTKFVASPKMLRACCTEATNGMKIITHDADLSSVRRTVLDLSPDLTNNTLAQTGDLTNYETGELTLAPGTYTIYAFANVDGYDGEFGTGSGQRAITQMTMTEFLDDCFAIDQQVRDGDLAEYRIYNPAENLYFANGMYIPMSAKKTITITPNTRDISIGLDRLVSKVKITVPDNQYISTSSTIQFSGYAKNVPLLGADNGGYGDAQLYGGTATTDKMPFNQVGEDVSFYVNETPGGNPFTVTLSTGKSGNGDVSAYVAKTQRTDIPRNSIYPLSLTFPEFGFNLTPTAWLYVTGVPYAVYYSVEENAFKVEIATGSFFNLAPGNVTDSDGEHQATWTWTVPEQQYEGLNISLNQDGVIEGNVPAGNEYIGYKYTLHLNGKWTDNAGHSFDRSYTVVVDVCHDEAWAIAHRIQGGTTTRGAKAEAPVYMLAPENLNMFKMK